MATIGEASRRSGVGIEAIRYYERTGVVAVPARTPAGRRDFSDSEIARLRMIRRCRDLGFSLSHSRRMLALASESDAACTEMIELARQQQASIRQKISELRLLDRAITEIASECRVGKSSCPALSRLLD